jgi:RNA polymerase sigma-70 factor (ECF subfamily)
LGPWFFAVARNSILTALGKNRKFAEREIALENLPETPTEETDGGLEDSLYHALRALPKANRQAVEMLKLKGMDLENASKAIGISKSALKVRAHRGYVLLRKILLERN